MKKRKGLPSMEAVLNALKHAVNPAQEGNDPNYKKCYLHSMLLLVTRPSGIKSI